MTAFWLARARIFDPIQYAKYNEATKEASKNYPRKVLARGGRFQVMEGETHFDRFVILEYPSFDAALDYFHSPGYQDAVQLRKQGAGEVEVVILEGVSDPTR